MQAQAQARKPDGRINKQATHRVILAIHSNVDAVKEGRRGSSVVVFLSSQLGLVLD
jgi:hypothetical protein